MPGSSNGAGIVSCAGIIGAPAGANSPPMLPISQRILRSSAGSTRGKEQRINRLEAVGAVGSAKGCSWTSHPPLRMIRARRIDIEVDVVDAALRLGVPRAGVPGPVAQLHVADLRKPKAAPLATRRQSGTALTGKLKCQCLLLRLAVAEKHDAQFAPISLIVAKDLSAGGHRLGEQFVCRAWRGPSHVRLPPVHRSLHAPAR